MRKVTVFIDESGALADPKDRFVVFAAVVSDDPQSLEKLIPKARKRVPPKKKRKRERLVSEFKFRSVGDNTKERILREIVKQKAKLFVLTVDKEGRKIEDIPKNYAFLITALLKPILKKEIVDCILIDRHYNQEKKQVAVTQEIIRLCQKEMEIYHVDSLIDSRIDLADFVAGAVLKSVRDAVFNFKALIETKIENQDEVTWKNVKSGRT